MFSSVSVLHLLRCAGCLGLLAALGLAGCQPRDGRSVPREREWLSTSFEELMGWLPNPQGLTSEKAHTGRYSLCVSPQQPYSMVYHAALGTLSPHHRPRRITVGAWVWVPNSATDAHLVVVLVPAKAPDQPTFQQLLYFTDSGPYGAWKYVSRRLELPEVMNSTDQLKLYLWASGSSVPVYADDVRVTELW